MKIVILILSVVFTGPASYSQASTPNPSELGTVQWMRSYEEALSLSAKQNKPVLILFQEVPGCATCKKFGKKVMSDPQVVEIIQNEFIPLAIFNNKKGEDARILNIYNEPSWNNPVLRIVDSHGKNITERIAGIYDKEEIILTLSAALQLNTSVPPYLELWTEEYLVSEENTSEVIFSMYCFWSGEAKLAEIEGVIKTEAAYLDNKEVVKVWYNNDQLQSSTLLEKANTLNYNEEKNNPGYHIDKEQQYYLSKSDFRYLALSPIQRIRINSLLAKGKDATHLLSPTQKNYLNAIQSTDNKKKNLDVLYIDDFEESWNFMVGRLNNE